MTDDIIKDHKPVFLIVILNFLRIEFFQIKRFGEPLNIILDFRVLILKVFLHTKHQLL
jgi:hypothetical protein